MFILVQFSVNVKLEEFRYDELFLGHRDFDNSIFYAQNGKAIFKETKRMTDDCKKIKIKNK